MQCTTGDIVEILPRAPYTVTKPGTRWVIYNHSLMKTGDVLVTLGEVPPTYSAFQAIKALLDSDTYSARRELRKQGLKFYTIPLTDTQIVAKMGVNKDFAALLSTAPLWEEPVSPRKDRLSMVSSFLHDPDEFDHDLPF